MLRIILSSDIKPILEAQGWTLARIQRVMKHQQVQFRYKRVSPAADVTTYDILVDTDPADLPPAAVTFLRNNAAVLYVAEWDLKNGAPYHATTNPDGYRIFKGTDPGYHKFAGWPV
jgi:hypothetical protein